MLSAALAAVALLITPTREPPACLERLPHVGGWHVHLGVPSNRASWQPFQPGWGGAEWVRKGDGRHTIRECHPWGDRRA